VSAVRQNCTWLLKPGELALKGKNRKSFENILKRNILRMLADSRGSAPAAALAKLKTTDGRYFIEAPEENSGHVENVLSRLIGISGWAKTVICQKTAEAVIAACVEEGKKLFSAGIKTFKIDARRTDKSFPLDSYELCCRAGEAVTQAVSGLKVDIHNPQDVIRIEIREKAYIYSGGKKALGGLPVGSAGRGLLLLSEESIPPSRVFLWPPEG